MQAAFIGIYQDIKGAIERGTYKFGGFLPSESALVSRFGCAHNTVRKAIELLAREGYVQPIHGKGVRVIYRPLPSFFDPRPDSAIDNAPRYSALEAFRDNPATCTVLSMKKFVVSPEFAASTGFVAGQKLMHLERVRSYKGANLELEEIYVQPDIVSGITKQIAQGSVYDYVKSIKGALPATAKSIIYMDRANERDYELLDMGDADYLALILCEIYDNNGTLCAVTSSRQHPRLFAVPQVVRHVQPS